MKNIQLLFAAFTATIHTRMIGATAGVGDTADARRDRGAVSLEQVLWFVAAGVSVAVIAAIIWNQIKTQANTPVNVPTAP
jgi:hypothetical protein